MPDPVAYFSALFSSGWAVGVAFFIGATWISLYFPPLFKDARLWLVMVASAFFTIAIVRFVYVPLADAAFWHLLPFPPDPESGRLLLLQALGFIFTCFVEEGAKMVPIVAYWRYRDRKLSPKMGLIVGACAGAAFGIIYEQGQLVPVFTSGVFWNDLETYGIMAFTDLWDDLFVAASTAFSAVAGYGLAKGKGWQFYLIAVGLHALRGVGFMLNGRGILTWRQSLAWVIIVAAGVTAWALWLRWRKTPEINFTFD
jgi:RsiW-degrading membrane proteinase PrsW (M82 family)